MKKEYIKIRINLPSMEWIVKKHRLYKISTNKMKS